MTENEFIIGRIEVMDAYMQKILELSMQWWLAESIIIAGAIGILLHNRDNFTLLPKSIRISIATSFGAFILMHITFSALLIIFYRHLVDGQTVAANMLDLKSAAKLQDFQKKLQNTYEISILHGSLVFLIAFVLFVVIYIKFERSIAERSKRCADSEQ